VIEKVFIQNFKIFPEFTLILNEDLNIIVGDNETGKSTILEAISLALTKKISGRPAEYEISPHLFNQGSAKSYLEACRAGKNPEPPRILVELYLKDDSEMQAFRGTNNSQKEDCVGIKVEIEFDEAYRDEYARLLEDAAQLRTIPAEYYRIHWRSFADNEITTRSLGIVSSHIDATTIRLQSGTDYYLQNIIASNLNTKERVALSVAYRKLREQFSQESSISSINKKLTENKAAITKKNLAITIDISQKSNWETSLVPHLDELPFHLIGKGEQSMIKTLLALESKGSQAHVILMEEPENHLSFSRMNILLSEIGQRCTGKQLIIATHSAYVLNKLGIEKVILLNQSRALTLKNLSLETYNYFKKLSGYDTLRLILAKKAILVEGPSDELIVQKAYRMKHNKLPIENGIDVINVRGLSFPRFLDIATQLGTQVVVVTDNDGDYKRKVEDKYLEYKKVQTIRICADTDNTANTLERQILKCNELKDLNVALGTQHRDENSMIEYMINNKTECALKLFETDAAFNVPAYIEDAVQ
jgi:putative ATP-dependent endonuclease of OLD family